MQAYERKKTLIYVGCHRGDSLIKLIPEYEICIAFEANPSLYEYLLHRFSEFDHVKIYNYAVSNYNGTTSFNITNNDDGASSSIGIFDESWPHFKQGSIKVVDTIQIECINLYDFLISKNIQFIDYYLSDAQGMDLEILKTLKPYIEAGRVHTIQCEVSKDEKRNIYKDLPSNSLSDFKNLIGTKYQLVAQGWGTLENGKFTDVPDDWWEMDCMWCMQSDRESFLSQNIPDKNITIQPESLTSNQAKIKIVGLVPARNEANIICQCLRALSLYTDAIVFLDDASQDETLRLVESISKECKIEKIIKKTSWYRDEPGDRNLLLQHGREIGGTHFIILDADEIITSNCLIDNFLRNTITTLKSGEKLFLNWIQLWRSSERYRHDRSIWTWNYKDFAFCDDGCCYYKSNFIHTPRTPENLSGNKYKIAGYKYGVMHFQFVNWNNLLIKQAWYRCFERIRLPEKSAQAINQSYAATVDESDIRLQNAPSDWFFSYPWFDKQVYERSNPWYKNQVLNWLNLFSSNHFYDLDIWNIDWSENVEDTIKPTLLCSGKSNIIVLPNWLESEEVIYADFYILFRWFLTNQEDTLHLWIDIESTDPEAANLLLIAVLSELSMAENLNLEYETNLHLIDTLGQWTLNQLTNSNIHRFPLPHENPQRARLFPSLSIT